MLEVCPGATLQGEWIVPGDKSISHRALIIAALADGRSEIRGMSYGQDCLATLKILQQCGVQCWVGDERVVIMGRGQRGLLPPSGALDCGNSGTTLRLLAGVLAAHPFEALLTGDASLLRRPMRRIVDPLRQMGACIEGMPHESGEEYYAPLSIRGRRLQGITYTLPVASAQVKSSLLLAGVVSQSAVVLHEPVATRDHSERLLKQFGAMIQSLAGQIELQPGGMLRGQTVEVPGDFSSAAFAIVGATLNAGSYLRLRRVGVNPTRTGLLAILRAMGADIVLEDHSMMGEEPVASIVVRAASLHGIEVPPAWVTSAIDEFPIIFIAAALATGTTVIRGIRELRFKESDRLSVMANTLSRLGIAVTEWDDGIAIVGGRLQGGEVDAVGDHRVAMAWAIAGMRAEGLLRIIGAENIPTSFPGFVDWIQQIGKA